MVYRRYGKFRFLDFYATWLGSFVLSCLGIVLIMMGFSNAIAGISPYYGAFPILIAIIMICEVLLPNGESFVIKDRVITTKKFRKTKEYVIPPEVTLIITYADIRSMFAKRRVDSLYLKQSHVLNNKYTAVILKKTPVTHVLELRQKHGYMSSAIEDVFGAMFIYSFVCNQKLLNTLLQSSKCNVIIPASLCNQVMIDGRYANVYIDTNY